MYAETSLFDTGLDDEGGDPTGVRPPGGVAVEPALGGLVRHRLARGAWIDLLPDWQGRGYGRQLMRTFLGALRDGGVPSVHLVMAAANKPARAFYDRMGFEEIDAPMDDSVACLGRTTHDLDGL